MKPYLQVANGTKRWYLKGQLHRENGPAVEWVNDNNEWHLNGVEYTENEFNEKMSTF